MITRSLAMWVLVGVATAAYGQGTVNFETFNLGPSARVHRRDGTGLFGNGWFAQLYAAAGTGAAEGALAKVGNPVNFRGISATSSSAGYVQTFGTTSKGV